MNLPNSLHMTILGQTNYMSNDEKTALHISEQNMDYAAKEFYGNHKYISSVLVQVPENGGTIRFGIEVLRGDPRATVGPFSISQTISLVLLLAGGVLIYRSRAHLAAH